MPVSALPWLLSNNFHSIIMKHVIGANGPVIEAFYVVLNWFQMSVYFVQFGSVKFNYRLLQEYFASHFCFILLKEKKSQLLQWRIAVFSQTVREFMFVIYVKLWGWALFNVYLVFMWLSDYMQNWILSSQGEIEHVWLRYRRSLLFLHLYWNLCLMLIIKTES